MPSAGRGKYEQYKPEVNAMFKDGQSKSAIAQHLKEKYKIPASVESVRSFVRDTLKDIEKINAHPALSEECDNVGIPISDVNHYWHKGKHFSVFVKGKTVTYEELKDEIVSEMVAHAPKYRKVIYAPNDDGHLLVIDPADIHLNKLCSAFETSDECNHDIVYNRVIDGVRGILQKAKGFKIDKILFIGGNDILHVDNPRNTTTSGTPQDSSMMWYDAFRLARKLIVECLEMLIPIAPIHFMYNPSNHDYTNGFFLAQTIEAWFRNCEHITFDVTIAHRKYFDYGENIIGSTHGDGAKETDLGLLMAHEVGAKWHECKHRYYYTHHIHHKKSKDYMSVCVESLRSPSGTDGWHSKSGYSHQPKAVEAFIHHKKQGQIARITNIF